MKITREWVDALKPGDRAEYSDDELPGLRLRVSETGARAWSVFVTLPTGRRKRLTIGSAHTIGPRQAREKARQLAAEARLGKTPKRDRRGPTLGSLAEAFQQSHEWARMAPVTKLNWGHLIQTHIVPKLGTRAPETVTRNDVRRWAGEIASERPTTANRAFEVLRRIYNWSLDGELIACANPCARLAKPAPERRRERVYSDAELKRILAASVGTEVEVLVRLIMLTLLRSGETRAIRLGWIDADGGLLTIPPEVTKNGTAHPVPLAADAGVLLRGLQLEGWENVPSPVMRAEAAAQERGLSRAEAPLFPAATKEGYMDPPIKAVGRVGESAKVTDLRLHDLRRTSASRMEAAGVESDVIEAALGHSRPSLARTYRPAFPTEKVRVALRTLAEHYRDALGLAWWEPDEGRREAIAEAMARHDL